AELFDSTLGSVIKSSTVTIDPAREAAARDTSKTDHYRPADAMPDEAWGRLRQGFAELVRGLRALHESGSVHRDVKPSNVLVADGDRVIVLDFGLVTELHHAGGQEGT